MLYGIEQSSDLKNRKTVVKKFTSEKSLFKWLENSGGFTYKDPESARNYHHTFRYGYEIFGKIDKKDEIFKNTGTRDYPRMYEDNLAFYIYKFGKEIT